ncbi:MAG: hypothetical protein AAFS12_15075, partial [Cyanobacteria bacterium J06632_19]
IKILTVNPAYSSLIGLVKYSRQYGLASDESAAFVIARRAQRLAENIPHSINAYLDVKPGKHVWSAWNQLNKKIKACTEVRTRHSYYSTPNWDFLVKEPSGTKPTGAKK